MTEPLTTLSPEQMERRRKGVGSSLAPVILGLHPHKTPFEAWLSITKKDERLLKVSDELQVSADFGVLVEPVIAQLYQRKHPELDVRHTGAVTRQLDGTIAMATTDYEGLVSGVVDRIVECKSRDYRTFRAFGEAGTDQVPEEIGAQVQWQMLVTGRERADVAVLVDRRLFEFPVIGDKETQETMLGLVTDWWERYVVKREEPPMTGKAVEPYLRKKFALVLNDIRRADPSEVVLLERFVTLRASIKEEEAHLAAIRADLLASIAHSKGIESDDFRALWSQRKGSTRVDWEAVAKEYRTMLGYYNGGSDIAVSDFVVELDNVVDRNTKTGESTRVLTVRSLTSGEHE